MHALIRKGNGEYYISAVFGYYSDKKNKDYYGTYYVVFDENKEKLIKQQTFNPKSKPNLELMVLIVEPDTAGWNEDEHGFGGVEFLSKDDIDYITYKGECPEDIMRKCHELDDSFQYTEYNEIHDAHDIDRLMNVSGYFHDAYIKEIKETENGLYVLFDGAWGCRIELYFEGDISYDLGYRADPENHDQWWYGSTMLIRDGFIYFIDDDDMTVEAIEPGYCWFKARKVKYKVIPD